MAIKGAGEVHDLANTDSMTPGSKQIHIKAQPRQQIYQRNVPG